MSKPEPQTIAAIKRYRAVKIARLVSRCYYYSRRGHKSKIYGLVGDELLSLGGIYIKFLQTVILQSPNMLKHWKNPQRLSIFERLNTEPLDIHRFLTESLGGDAERLESISPEPFAAGSFGQVYMAKLDQKDVVIKVMRPQVNEFLKFDLRLLRWFWRVCNRYLANSQSLDLNLAFDDFAEQTLSEVDYVAEAQFATDQYTAYHDHPKLVIPKTYLELCRDNLIVQDYVGGISVVRLVELHDQGVDVIKYTQDQLGSKLVDQFQTLAYELTWGVFSMPKIMGDAHPGNIKLLPNNKIALIDFGLAAIPGNNQSALLDLIIEYHNLIEGRFNAGKLFVSYLRFFGRDLYRALKKLSTMTPGKIDINQKLGQLAEENVKQLLSQEDIDQISRSPKAISILDNLANQDNRLALQTKVEDSQVIRAGLAFHSLLANLGLYRQVMGPVYEKVLPRIHEAYPELRTQTDPEISSAQALDIVSGWLERVANRNPSLFRELIVHLQLPKRLDEKLDPDQLKLET